MSTTQPITRLLLEWRAGSDVALEQLTPLVYGELRRLAGAYLNREKAGLCATSSIFIPPK